MRSLRALASPLASSLSTLLSAIGLSASISVRSFFFISDSSGGTSVMAFADKLSVASCGSCATSGGMLFSWLPDADSVSRCSSVLQPSCSSSSALRSARRATSLGRAATGSSEVSWLSLTLSVSSEVRRAMELGSVRSSLRSSSSARSCVRDPISSGSICSALLDRMRVSRLVSRPRAGGSDVSTPGGSRSCSRLSAVQCHSAGSTSMPPTQSSGVSLWMLQSRLGSRLTSSIADFTSGHTGAGAASLLSSPLLSSASSPSPAAASAPSFLSAFRTARAEARPRSTRLLRSRFVSSSPSSLSSSSSSSSSSSLLSPSNSLMTAACLRLEA
mmetsp:Transcript_13905/g.44561  ORF Transcript_13905/g.44561 Transcript_13905/m.44561 type:complete len:330 (+) Transcript_13905:91-1080(+)